MCLPEYNWEVIVINPIVNKINTFNAKTGATIPFIYTGSKQLVGNTAVISRVADGEIVYSFLLQTIEKSHHIPPTVLSNGEIYSIKIKGKFSDGTESDYSNSSIFRTFTTPVVDITNIDGKGFVYNRDVTFVASYTQENNEKIKSYRFSLFDENRDLLQLFPIRYPSVSLSELTETVRELEKGLPYYIKVDIETVNGIIYYHTERFTSMYIVPSLSGLISLENDDDEGFIRVDASVKQSLGTPAIGVGAYKYEYTEDGHIYIPKDRTITFSNLNMGQASDFYLKLWFKDLEGHGEVLKLYKDEKQRNDLALSISYVSDGVNRFFEVEKSHKGVKSLYKSNNFTSNAGMLYVRVIEHRIDLMVKEK